MGFCDWFVMKCQNTIKGPRKDIRTWEVVESAAKTEIPAEAMGFHRIIWAVFSDRDGTQKGGFRQMPLADGEMIYRDAFFILKAIFNNNFANMFRHVSTFCTDFSLFFFPNTSVSLNEARSGWRLSATGGAKWNAL